MDRFFKKNNSVSQTSNSNPVLQTIKTPNGTSTSQNIKPPNNKINSKFTSKTIISTICIIIILCIIIYFSICIINYYYTECYTKKSLLQYLFDFSNNDVCDMKNPPPKPVKISKPILPDIEKILPPIVEDKNEVFHIANQDYTYDQSKCKCESYGARLATKAEVTDAYNNGANWCTYGWTDGQNAYYPVQQCEWDKINKQNERLPNNEKDYCGVPGLNGGYFPNPLLKFGVNCYGKKPKGSVSIAKKPYCPPMNFCKLDTNFQASNVLNTDEIVGFNEEQWNMKI